MGFSRHEYWSGVPLPSPKAFVYIWLIILFLFSHGTCPRTLPRYEYNFLLRWTPPQKPVGVCPHLLWAGTPSLYDPRGVFLCSCRQGSFPDLRNGHPSGRLPSSLQQSSAPAARFVLECLGENKASVSLHFQTPGVQPRGLSTSSLSSRGPNHLCPPPHTGSSRFMRRYFLTFRICVPKVTLMRYSEF